ncbi:uncharacterized protein LOC141902220 [Tubulanus polymorphus]|uniref:uncharacterized protein LOC141902220 n=1 Tax=Tubulanus polymorphus TaxID=672921 RepID=UPI003DA61AAC
MHSRRLFFAVVILFVIGAFGNLISRAAEEEEYNVLDRILKVNEMAERRAKRDQFDDNEDETADDGINRVNQDIPLLEGDILISEDEDEENEVDKRSAIKNGKLWPVKDIPYVLDSSLSSSGKALIPQAIAGLESKTCLKFRLKKTGDQSWLRFFRGQGCYSYIGKAITGAQPISIGTGCEHHGVITHEIMHALGFHHEHSRPDRDLYVRIMFENILDGRASNFHQRRDNTDKQGLNYDYGSVMHYGSRAFTKNGQPTIVALKGSQTFGQRNGPSALDITGINILYGCPTVPGTNTTQWSLWSNCNDRCVKTRNRFCASKTECPNANDKGIDVETQNCSSSECQAKIDGHWGQWSTYGACSTSCGTGTQQRTRQCDNPAPKHGGNSCPGISVESAQCVHSVTCTLGKLDTNFDNDYGMWTTHGTLQWTRRSGTTPSSSTGPNGDHTTGTGTYVYVETSSPASRGQQAYLDATINSTSDSCQMNFNYHMYGSSMGKLQVKVDGSVLFEKSGNQGNNWKAASVTIGKGHNIDIEFVATRGYCFRSDMALDDISFIGCASSPAGTTAFPTTLMPVTTVAPVTSGPITPPVTTASPVTSGPITPPVTTPGVKLDTNFENDNGMWTTHGTLQWTRRSGTTPSSYTGPSGDHTTGTGTYVYVESSYPASRGQQAYLDAKINSVSDSCQMDFNYHMYGSSMGKLQVTVNGSVLFEKSGNQGDNWKAASVTIGKGHDMNIEFVATRGDSYKSDMALDDISFSGCASSPPVTTVFPTTSMPVTTVSPVTSGPITPPVTTASPVTSRPITTPVTTPGG